MLILKLEIIKEEIMSRIGEHERTITVVPIENPVPSKPITKETTKTSPVEPEKKTVEVG